MEKKNYDSEERNSETKKRSGKQKGTMIKGGILATIGGVILLAAKRFLGGNNSNNPV